MQLAEMVLASNTSRDVISHLRCHDFKSIRPILQQLSVEQLHVVISMSFLELGTLRNTPHLDVIFKETLREEQKMLATIRSEVMAYNREVFRIDHELKGYSKYQAQCVLHGMDPRTYHEWCDLQESNAKLTNR